MLNVLGSVLVAACTLSLATAAFAQDACPSSTDINGDGQTDAADVEIIQAALGQVEGDEGFVPEADLNGDGYISTVDYMVMLDCS